MSSSAPGSAASRIRPGRMFHFHLRDRQILLTFWGTILFGLVAHGMGLLNKYSYHDDIFALFWTGTTIASGRWMLHVLGWLETMLFGDGNFSLPLMSGLFSIVCVAFSACLLTDLLKIRKPLYSLALGCIMVAFPVMTGLFGYLFTMPYYMLAMAMMTFSAFLICRARPWWAKLAAVLLAGCSIGTYQAFLPLLLSIPLLYDIQLLSEEEQNPADFWKRAAIQVLCIVGALVFYLAANRFFLNKFQVELNAYMGLNQMESFSPELYLGRIGTAYGEFFLPARNVPADMYPMHLYYLSRLMLIVDLGLALRLILQTGRQNRVSAGLLILLFLLFPLGCHFIYVMSEKVHGLMTYGLIMQTALFVWLADRWEPRPLPLRRIVSCGAALVLGLSCWMYARFDNQCYLKANFQQQEAVSFFTALEAQIKSSDGYRDELPVVFLNEGKIADRTLYNIDELDFIRLDGYNDTIQTYINSYAWRPFMERWCGFSPPEPDEEILGSLPSTEDMPHYPDDGSVRVMENYILVNF